MINQDKEAQIQIMKPNDDNADIAAIEDEYKIIESEYLKEKDRLKARSFFRKAGESVVKTSFSILKSGLGASASLSKNIANKTLSGLNKTYMAAKQKVKGYEGMALENTKAFTELAYLFDTQEKKIEFRKPIYQLKQDSLALASIKTSPPNLKFFKDSGAQKIRSNFEKGIISPDITDIITNHVLANLLTEYTPFGILLDDPTKPSNKNSNYLDFDISMAQSIISVLLGTTSVENSFWDKDSYRICPFMYFSRDASSNIVIRYDMTPNTINYLLILAAFIYEHRSMYDVNNLNESIQKIIINGNQKSSIESIYESIKKFREYHRSISDFLKTENKKLKFYSDLQLEKLPEPITLSNFYEFDVNDEYKKLSDIIKLYFKKYSRLSSIDKEEVEMRNDILTELVNTRFFS